MLTIHDRIYGIQNIRETVLIELINSPPMQRLKRINQAGASQYILPHKTISRFEHSVGVMLLLKRFGATIDEQISGLLHDVPHTAFSHVIDFVFQNRNHEYHELFHEHMVASTEIGTILKRHSISDSVIHPEHFGLLERNIPDLCADRIDYALRDYAAWKYDAEAIQAKLDGLIVHRGEFIFNNQISAESFATDYITLDKTAWSNPKELAAYVLLAQALQHALEKKIVTHDDLFTDDATLFTILQEKGDAYVQKKMGYLTPLFRVETATKQHHHLYLTNKTRYVDPKILKNGKIKRLSELSTRYKKMMDAHRAEGKKGWYVFVYSY